ncbi:competence/damage-inducible protein A [bacterium]|nr:competence/damage-inducible protein A [bacterium]
MDRSHMEVALLVIGNEILRGDTLDSNSNFLAGQLAKRGARLRRILTIPDELELIASELRSLSAQYERVITTGGIGPTPDDLTRDAVAMAFDVGLVLFEDAVAEWQARRGTELNEGQLAMCTLPEGSRLIRTQSTPAPGFAIGNVYVLAGVPSVMKEMWSAIAEEFSGTVQHVASFQVRMPESRFAAVLRDYQGRFPELDFGSYPKMEGEWYTEIKVHGDDPAGVAEVGSQLEADIRALES